MTLREITTIDELREHNRALRAKRREWFKPRPVVIEPPKAAIVPKPIINFVPPPPSQPIEIIVDIVCKHFEVSRRDLLSKRRSAFIALPRLICYLLALEQTDYTMPRIASAMKRDHTTVIIGIRSIRMRISNNLDLKATVEEIRRKVLAENDKSHVHAPLKEYELCHGKHRPRINRPTC